MQTIDEYTIIKQVGGSERFRVYHATGPDGPVTLKVAINRSAQDLAHLRREREVARHLDVPGLRYVRAIRQSEDGYVYSVSEWADSTLRQEMTRRRRFRKAEVIKTLGPVAQALDEMHARQYVHCTLSPENILLGGDGRVLVIGLAHVRRRGQHPGPSDPRYAAPERTAGQPVGPWCDVYSLGVIAYQMLSGSLPFAGTSAEEWQRAHAVTTPQLTRRLRRGLGRDASRALMRALAKEPADRFHSAASFVEALREEEPTSVWVRHAFVDTLQGLVRVAGRAPRFVKVMALVMLLAAGVAAVASTNKPGDVTVSADPRTATAAFVAALQTPNTIWTPRPLHSPSPSATPGQQTAAPAPGTATAATATSEATTPTATPEAQPPTSTPPPTAAQRLHPAPTLIEPADVTRFSADSGVDLVWEYPLALQPGEEFDIRVWKAGDPPWGIARSTGTRYRVGGAPRGPGEYLWVIVVVRDDPNTGKVIETSHPSATRRIYWG